jgi:anhydro-N-acetylmuramic acid kinase
MRVAGIMSGTSLDGVDVAIVDIAGRRVETVAHHKAPYSKELRARILAVSDAACATRDISRLNFELGEVYARVLDSACRKNRIAIKTLDLIGCHGQTIYHEGKGTRPNTLQIGEASILAEKFGIPVVSDFRTRDVAAGGAGAPLVPFADVLLFHSPRKNRVALNIGGIANITVLPRKMTAGAVAFDTGPGNMVMDQLVAHSTNGKQSFDRNGRMASQGHPNRELLDRLLRAPWFRQKPPKTAGREQYGAAYVSELLNAGLGIPDLLATAATFTAASIALAIRDYAPGTEEIIAAGGGVHNSLLMARLVDCLGGSVTAIERRKRLSYVGQAFSPATLPRLRNDRNSPLAAFAPRCRITTTAEFGIDPDAKEAIAFAVLAARTWRREPGNLPSATGARHPVILGKLTR